MRAMTRRRAAIAMFVLVVIVAAAVTARPYVHGITFVIRVGDLQGVARRIAEIDTVPLTERELRVPVTSGELRARAYEPAGLIERTALLVSGLHPDGIDEARLVGFARHLTASGIAVVTPDIPDLSKFAVTPTITDAIEQTAAWLASNPAFAPDGRVGIMGISFSGGLSIVAAGRPSIRDRVAYVFALGGHGDLPRVLRYLCTGFEPAPSQEIRLTPDSGSTAGRADAPPPHDFGVVVILLGVADRLVPPRQVEPLRSALARFLSASQLARVNRPEADREFGELRALAKTLPEPSATLLHYVNNRDVVHLGARLLPYVSAHGASPALSVSRSPKPTAPVFLLHGIDDNVIPAAESVHLADDLRGYAPVRLVLSNLISHAEVERPPRVTEVLEIAGFWGDLLRR
jgi:dienelactone hydrolase